MSISVNMCSICSLNSDDLQTYIDGNDRHFVCTDCLSYIDARFENPGKWRAFIGKHGDGADWFEFLPLPSQAINKLHCK